MIPFCPLGTTIHVVMFHGTHLPKLEPEFVSTVNELSLKLRIVLENRTTVYLAKVLPILESAQLCIGKRYDNEHV